MRLLKFMEKLDLDNPLKGRGTNEEYTIYNGRPTSI